MLQTVTDLVANLPASPAEIVGLSVAALLTVAVLSFILGHNPFFRLAEYLFVGVAAGYAASVAWNSALWPRLRLLLSDPVTYWFYGLFFALGILLLARGVKPLSMLGNLPLAGLFGTGAALAIAGAVSGSLVPQLRATTVSVSPMDYGEGIRGWTGVIDAVLLVLGTITVLSAFHFTAWKEDSRISWAHGLLGHVGSAGRKVMMIAFGALLAGALVSFFALLKSRLDFLIYGWGGLFGGTGL